MEENPTQVHRLCLESLKNEYGAEIFDANSGMKELIDDICSHRISKDRFDIVLNDPLLKIDMR